ncbi:LytR family transcriptional regulator, partial [Micrococcus lylae]
MAYTPDRFDDVPEYTDQRGAHRDHFEGAAAAGAGVRPFLLIAVAAILVGLFVGVALPFLQRGDDSTTADATASVTATASDDAASASGDDEREGTAASETEEAKKSEDAEESKKAEASTKAEESRKA